MKQKVLICGLGSVGKRHFKNLLNLGFEDIILLRRENSHQEVLDRNFPTFSSLLEALQQQPTVSIICTPTHMHIDAAIECANSGSHVFIEKPISNSLRRVDELKSICSKKNLVCMVGYMMRYHPLIIKMKELISEDKIGNLIYLKTHWGEYLPDTHPWEDYRKSYAARKEMGGGPALSLSHDLDLILWIVGSKVKSSSRLDSYRSSLELNCEHASDFLIEFDNGVTSHAHLDFFQKPAKRIIEVIGEKGSLEFNYYKNKLEYKGHVPDDKKIYYEEKFDRNQLFISEMIDFFQSVEKNLCSSINIDGSLELLNLIGGKNNEF